MPLVDDERFRQRPFDLPADVLAQRLDAHPVLRSAPWVYCGYAPLPPLAGLRRPVVDVQARVDNAFRLVPACGFEQAPVVVTTGIRSSRFASVIAWEVLHVLAIGGTWIDIDDGGHVGRSPFGEDVLDRQYFRTCLTRRSTEVAGGVLVQTFQKTQGTTLSARIEDAGWTFGILTSGESPRAADMTRAILALDLPEVEVVFCGPRPSGVPVDDRVRAIDLDAPEPRGWISRKKNLLADAARFENLCLLHDRFVVTPEWARALREYGSCFSILTFPQVYFADLDRRFPQRYADYQVLHQQHGVNEALAHRVFAGERVLYAPYDDFYETAFCCGGLYLAKKSLWTTVRQDEALYHCEWEDIVFGLECQRRGIPHRVNPLLTVESLTPHPMALTRLHDLVAPDTPSLGRLHVTPAHADAAVASPDRFKPVFQTTRSAYVDKVTRRFNALPHLAAPIVVDDGARSLTGFWRAIERGVMASPPRTRDEIAAVIHALSDTVYNWPACEQQAWIHAHEHALNASLVTTVEQVVGWGTGSLFAATHTVLGRDLAFVVDGNPARWGGLAGGYDVRPPSALRDCDPARTAVVVFSCFVDDIRRAVADLGPFAVLPVNDLLATRRLRPLADVIGYFEEVERYYPAIFADAAAPRPALALIAG